MLLEKLSLFRTKKEFFTFIFIALFIFTYSLLIEFNNYKNLTQFNSNIVTATIIKQYEKTKFTKKDKIKIYQVLKLKSDKGYSFYTTASQKFPNSLGKKLQWKFGRESLVFMSI